MQFFSNPNFDFMSRRRLFVGLSTMLLVASVIVLATNGINRGIEFTGGTELQLKFTERPDVAAIRAALGDAGMTSQVVTTIGEIEDHEIYVKLGVAESDVGGEDPVAPVIAALRQRFGSGESRPDINIVDASTLADVLEEVPELGGAAAAEVAGAIVELRKEQAIFHSHDDLAAVEGLGAEARAFLAERTAVGPMAIRSQSYIGPAIGGELARKALWAIGLSLVGMLVYIWLRFQLQWGFAAVIALIHDTLITLGLFSLFGFEMSLPVVAAFLTLVGYSVNDTVVIFDRVRENLKLRLPLPELINVSINQTLSRTTITSGLTWIVVAVLYVFGGPALRPFSFVLTIGIIIGTYSTFYIACPVLVLWNEWVAKRTGKGPEAVSAGPKKVRT